jgi:DNA-binding NtrC family response regulator
MPYRLMRDNGEVKATPRTVVLASADAHFRARLNRQLTAMRWQVREAGGGAEAIAHLEMHAAEAMVLDSVLPDLEVGEFASEMRSRHPVMDLLRVGGGVEESGARSPRRNELLHALRQAQVEGFATHPEMAVLPAREPLPQMPGRSLPGGERVPVSAADERAQAAREVAEMLRSREGAAGVSGGVVELVSMSEDRRSREGAARLLAERAAGELTALVARPRVAPLPEMVGESAGMQELARMVRLVSPRSTTVLIEGETGTGKELVAKAVHRLSVRAGKPFLVLNCAAIPEALLEAELFGHTRGAFTGAVQARTGRIEAANGGTLFLDEIGEMPLALQAKMLRFLESGELQRVGDNETLRVDVRVVAASHQPLERLATEGAFRLDLYHRLAVFPVKVPALRERMDDIPLLADYLLARLGEEMPVKRLSSAAGARLEEHHWPGNVRELAHVLERGAILAEDRREISFEEIRF